jgi:hypothetical protein
MMGLLRRLYAEAASLSGRRLAIVAGASVIATSTIVATALTAGGPGNLAALVGQSLTASAAPTEPETPAPSPAPSSPAPASGGQVQSAPSGSAPASAPVPTVQSQGKTAKSPKPPKKGSDEKKIGRVKHVFVVSLASPGFDAAFGPQSQMPYLANTLRPQGALLSDYALLSNAGLPNEIAAVSGQPPNPDTEANCPTYGEFPPSAQPDKQGAVPGPGCVYPVLTFNLADQVSAAGLTWKAYLEDMEKVPQGSPNCVKPDATSGGDLTQQPRPGNEYAARHNPFIYFHSLLDVGDCGLYDVPATQLAPDLASAKKTPNFTYIAPNLCHYGSNTTPCQDGSPGGAASADQYLSQLVPQILASPAYKKDGVLIVTFAERVPPDPSTPTPVAGTLLVSRFLTPNSTIGTSYNPYSMLRSIEDLFGLDYLAGSKGRKTTSFAPQLLGSGASAGD